MFKEIEKKWQKKWEAAKIFEVKEEKKEKFFITTPYPYISGSLHIGHARVVIEADVFSRYQRMLNKNVLFPLAFHISGTPVLSISLAIKNKDQKKIDLYKRYIQTYVKNEKEIEQIVNSFEDPQKIVDFFIPKMKDEFKTLGLGIDWRRSFTSGDIEHQALVEWQFKKYIKKNYLIQGKYPILFSKTLNNAVGEDDIQEGDTNPVKIQEFTLVKFKFNDYFLVAATLRPETLFGQTNLWIDPNLNYIKTKIDKEKWIISEECVEKLKYQDKKVKKIGIINGRELIGKFVFAPMIEKDIIILPSTHCDSKIGTGIVTSVPSDAPFDYIALKELQESKKLCEEYTLDYKYINNIKLKPIIKSKDFGDFPAKELCEKLNIKTLNQKDKLMEATQEIYKISYHTGIMNSSKYKGVLVSIAKEKMKQELIKKNKGAILYETSRIGYSRDGGEVIVAIIDGQWFLDFNAKGWKNKAKKCLKNIELWHEKYRKQFEDVFEWLDKRPCARKRGLGTKLPFDKEWVIESLSDSTIYMSLYPIIHFIRENKIKKEQLNYYFFDYVLLSNGNLKDIVKRTKINEELLKKMNKEFKYWYPFDHRHTFTAHLSNHLSFMLFAHTAIFNKKFWPKRISFHGIILSEGEKMSKSKGNAISLIDIQEKYSCDVFRAYICNSTSVESTFNWDSSKVEIMKKHLSNLFNILKKIQENKEKKDYSNYKSFISKTERSIKKAKESLDIMDLREYSNIVLYDMYNNYKKIKSDDVNCYIYDKWIRMLTPLIPHIAEELWDNSNFVSLAEWPEYDEKKIDLVAEYKEDLLNQLKEDIRKIKELIKKDRLSKITIYIADAWKYEFAHTFKELIKNTYNQNEIINSFMKTNLKKRGNEIVRLISSWLKDQSKVPEIILDKDKELKLILENKNILEEEFNCSVIIQEKSHKKAIPGRPAIFLE